MKGMTLRDYFAAKALTGLIAQSDKRMSCNVFAEEAYLLADAMLQRRKKKKVKKVKVDDEIVELPPNYSA